MAGRTFSEPGVTPLSHLKAPKSGGSSVVRALARLSLCSLMMALVAAGCVVPDPPEYGVARQTPPFLNLGTSGVFGLKEYDTGEGATVSVGVRSEDAGEDLLAQLFLNYSVGGPTINPPINFAFVSASTFDDESRQIDIPFSAPSNAGCYQMTLLVTHYTNVLPTKQPKDFKDVGIASWWISVVDPDDPQSVLLSACPKAGAGP